VLMMRVGPEGSGGEETAGRSTSVPKVPKYLVQRLALCQMMDVGVRFAQGISDPPSAKNLGT